MTRKTIIAFALFASYLVVTTAPVAASHGQLAVESEHSTDADFENASLDTMHVQGAGTSADVALNNSKATAWWKLDSGSGTTTVDSAGTHDGSITGATWVNAGPSGTALQFDGTDDEVVIPDDNELDLTDQMTLSAWVYIPEGETEQDARIISKRGNWDDDRAYGLWMNNGIFQFDGGNGAKRINIRQDVSQGWQHAALTYNQSDQSAEFYINGSLVGAEEIEGGLATTDNPLRFGQQADGSGEYFTGTLDEVRIYDHELSDSAIQSLYEDGTEPLVVEGGSYENTHDVQDAVRGWTHVSLSDATATVEWEGFDPATDEWQVVNSAQYSSSGNYTLDVSGTNYEKWRVDIRFEKTGSNPTAQLHDEGILVEPQAPEIDDSSLSPNSTETSTDESVTLSADISDSDFGTSYGDSVTVEWYVDGEQVGTSTPSSNGTVEHTVTDVGAGEHNWHVEVEDSYGHRTTSATAQFASPAELRVFNETDQTLVDGANESVELRFFFEGEDELIVERTIEDGRINMTGLPADESFVVVADAEGYFPRRIYVPSLFETQRIYLLPETTEPVSPQFTLRDYSGLFDPADSVLLIQRPLNESWVTVQADRFGATNQVPAQLAFNVRHRLVILNTETGERRDLRSFTPLQDGERTVEVTQSGDVEIGQRAVIQASPDPRTLHAVENSSVTVRLNNQSLTLESWNVTAVYAAEDGNETLASLSRSGPAGGTVEPAFDLSGRAGGDVIVHVDYRADDGTTGSESFRYSIQKQYENQYSLLNVLGGVSDLIPDDNVDEFTTMVAMIISIVAATATASVLRASTEAVGLAAVLSLAGFTVIGWVGHSLFFSVGVTWTAFSAYRRGL